MRTLNVCITCLFCSVLPRLYFIHDFIHSNVTTLSKSLRPFLFPFCIILCYTIFHKKQIKSNFSLPNQSLNAVSGYCMVVFSYFWEITQPNRSQQLN